MYDLFNVYEVGTFDSYTSFVVEKNSTIARELNENTELTVPEVQLEPNASTFAERFRCLASFPVFESCKSLETTKTSLTKVGTKMILNYFRCFRGFQIPKTIKRI